MQGGKRKKQRQELDLENRERKKIKRGKLKQNQREKRKKKGLQGNINHHPYSLVNRFPLSIKRGWQLAPWVGRGRGEKHGTHAYGVGGVA